MPAGTTLPGGQPTGASAPSPDEPTAAGSTAPLPTAPSKPTAPPLDLHSLRNPLTAIMGFAESLSREARRGPIDQDRLLDRLGRIRSAARRIEELLAEQERD